MEPAPIRFFKVPYGALPESRPNSELQARTERLLLQEVEAKEHQWLTELLLQSLAEVGEFTNEAGLPAILPRLSGRRYPDGTVILALDAQPKTDAQPGHLGQQLFGFGEAQFNRLPEPPDGQPARFGWTRPVLTGAQALLYEYRQRLPAQAFAYGTPELADEPELGRNPAADGSVNASDAEGNPPAVL